MPEDADPRRPAASRPLGRAQLADLRKLAALLASGEISTSTYVFEGGTTDWIELGQAQARLPPVAIM